MKTYITCINGRWYAFAGDVHRNQVYGIGRDCPPGGGLYYARWTDSGVEYVATASPTRSAAYQKARRAGEYGGETC